MQRSLVLPVFTDEITERVDVAFVDLVGHCVAALGLGVLPCAAESLPARVEFNKHVRPILSDKCFACHGPDPTRRDSGLRLDVREAALAERDGIRAFVPGKPDESDAIVRIFPTTKTR